MPNPPSQPRSVKIGADERTGWSSDRPRPGGGARAARRHLHALPRPEPVGPHALLAGQRVIIICRSPATPTVRRAAHRGARALLSPSKVRGLLAGRVDAEEVDARAAELLLAAARKRHGGRRVGRGRHRDADARGARAVPARGHDGAPPAPRDPARRRPRPVGDEERAVLNDLRSALDAGELGAEGFQTALRLNASAASELKKLLFRPPPREDD